MKIVGLQKLTLLDFPGRVACTLFLGGCNFRCPFCHNTELLGADAPELMSMAEFLSFIRSRAGVLDGVCVTGGEPTLYPDLPELLRGIRDCGLAVKLDTNGYRPDVLRAVVEAGLVDFVAMDVKNSPAAYAQTAGLADVEISRMRESLLYLLKGHVDYELRCTVVKPLHTEETVADMAEWLQALLEGKRAKRFYIQPFVDRDTVPASGLSAPEKPELERFCALLAPCAEIVELRGV